MDSTKPQHPEQNLVEACLLLDTYGEMLTERQRRFMRLHYEEDLSFSQIAREFRVSRQAVHDSVKHGLKALHAFEKALKLIEKSRTSQGERREGEKEKCAPLRQRLIALRNRAASQAPAANPDWIVGELDSLIASIRAEETTGE